MSSSHELHSKVKNGYTEQKDDEPQETALEKRKRENLEKEKKWREERKRQREAEREARRAGALHEACVGVLLNGSAPAVVVHS